MLFVTIGNNLIMKIFDYANYKDFIHDFLKTMPKKGHGQSARIAKILGVHSTMVTHILKGNAQLTIEQAVKLIPYFMFNELESEYFILLVQLERAGDKSTKQFFSSQLEKIKKRSMVLSERLIVKNNLGEEDQLIYYSEWFYSGIRLLTAIDKYQTRQELTQATSLPHDVISKTIQFLLEKGLCVEKDNKIIVGPTKTYVGSNSLQVSQHHRNWRIKLLNMLESISSEELVYTNPITISESDFLKIREELVQFIERFRKISEPSPSEKLCCLNLDWRKLY